MEKGDVWWRLCVRVMAVRTADVCFMVEAVCEDDGGVSIENFNLPEARNEAMLVKSRRIRAVVAGIRYFHEKIFERILKESS